MANTALANLMALQQATSANMPQQPQGGGGLLSQLTQAEGDLTEAQREQMVGGFFERNFWDSSKVSPTEFDEALAVQQATQGVQQQQALTGGLAGGKSGAGPLSQGEQGGMGYRANQLAESGWSGQQIAADLQNTQAQRINAEQQEASTERQGIQDEQQTARDMVASQDAGVRREGIQLARKADERAQGLQRRQNYVDMEGIARQARTVDDVMTVMADEGRMILPSQSKQFYNSKRNELALDLKNQYQLGVLSEQDFEILDSILGPRADALWSTGTQTERMEAMRLVKQTYTNSLKDKSILYESPFTAEQFIGDPRSVEDIMAPLRDNMERIDPTELPGTQPSGGETPTGPSGDLAPFGSFMKGIGF
jgi:hypothetical protein